MKLLDKKCVPCEGGTPPLTPDEIKKYLPQLTHQWEVREQKKIRHEFTFKDFKAAIVFVNQLSEVAEAEGHHPDITIHYNRVTTELWTHAIGGLSKNDFILAAKIEKLT